MSNLLPEKRGIAVVIPYDQEAMTIGQVIVTAGFRCELPDARLGEVAISYYGRTGAAEKKIGWRGGFHSLWCIFKYNFLAGS
jgi:hypothetical protein